MTTKFVVDKEQYKASIELISKHNKFVTNPTSTLEALIATIKNNYKNLNANENPLGLYSSTGGFFVVVEDTSIGENKDVSVYLGVYVDPVVILGMF